MEGSLVTTVLEPLYICVSCRSGAVFRIRALDVCIFVEMEKDKDYNFSVTIKYTVVARWRP